MRQRAGEAARRARAMLAGDPHDVAALRLLGRALRALGEDDAASEAELAAIAAAGRDPRHATAALALVDGDLPTAENLLRGLLRADPLDVAAIRMMAELAGRLGRYADAENLLRRALELAPGFAAARANLAMVLHRQNRSEDAVAELGILLADDPRNPRYLNLKAVALGRIGDFAETLSLYEQLLSGFPDQPLLWMNHGHVLKTVGRHEDSVAAYRRAVSIRPAMGEAWWSLANLKTARFDDADVAAMTDALAATDARAEDRYHLHFALGKAFEDRRDAARSFGHYAEGNRLRRLDLPHDPAWVTGQVGRSRERFDAGYFRRRSGHGCPDPDPIFIVGMPRAGSTLVEQILASHPAIEGTQELPDIPAIAHRLGQRAGGGEAYPAAVADLNADECAALGREYLDRARAQRKTGRPYFIDKMPNNWLHLPLIRSILPNAPIIDARRDPLACCFSNFKQHFARGQAFSYALEDIGLYYRDYVAMMDHVDRVQPGMVHRVMHEALLGDLEAEVRRLLDHLGLPFDFACLRFWQTDRAVRTASSEQVRRPLNRDGVDQWRPYEPWLGSLKAALGDLVPS